MEIEFDCIDSWDHYLLADFVPVEDYEIFFEESEEEDLKLQEISQEIIDCLFLSEEYESMEESQGFMCWNWK